MMTHKSSTKIRDGDFKNVIRNARFRRSESTRESNQITKSEEQILLMNFVEEKFHSIECRYFYNLEDSIDDTDAVCLCGGRKKYHKTDKPEYSNFDIWTNDRCLEISNTITYGKIEFVGEDNTNTKLTDFVRLSYRDKMKDVLDLLFQLWKIEVGTLCISIIGGSRNIKLHKKEKNIFCQGLIKAAKTTSALILTSGLNEGITKIVGDAIHDSQSCLYDKKVNGTICCLGIALWGSVKKRRILERAKGKTVQYKVYDETKLEKPISLNKNHTHYLFVDDGYRLQFSGKRAIEFRAVLENALNSKSGIPVVLLIVEGGHEVFVKARRSIKENFPIIICEGTGRAADLLGEAYREMHQMSNRIRRLESTVLKVFPREYKNILKKKLIEQNISDENQVEEAIRYIEDIVQNEFLITLFDIKSRDDLDRQILHSLIKKMDYICDSKESTISRQLSLCLLWNRVDIVKEKIFFGDISLQTDESATFLKESIIAGNVEFIELFVQNIANIDQFLTPAILRELYEKCPKSKNFHEAYMKLFGCQFSNDLSDVERLLSRIVGHYDKPWFKSEGNLKNPFKELFIWGVLMEKHECARFFWERCDESLCLALVATVIYKCLIEISVMDINRTETLTLWKNCFEQLAVKLLEECYDIDQETAVYLIEKENSTWGGMTCLELAYKADDKSFISSFVCQNSINYKWHGGFNIDIFHCLLCILFPLLVIFQLKYHKRSEHQKNGFTEEASRFKLRRFYLAPQTKFCIHKVTFMIFVSYFSYVVLYGMKRMTFTNHEIIFMFYLSLMILEKLIEIGLTKSFNFRKWWNVNNWNKLDLLLIIAAIFAMLLRLPLVITTVSYSNKVILYRWAKTTYSLIVGLFYIKCLRFLTFHKNLGPKLVMMNSLLEQLMIYIIIIIIFLLSYGVTSQATYYPQRDFSWLNLSNVLDNNFWAVFGVLNLPNTVYLNWCDNKTVYNTSNNCAEGNFVMPILYAAYIIISNILLINVLIATFSYTCHEIHKNSKQVWKFTMYSLVIEYNVRSILPLPFSLLIHVGSFFAFLYRQTACFRFQNKNSFDVSKTKQSLNKQNLSKSASLMISSDMLIKSELDKLVKYFENNSQKCVIKDLKAKTHNSTASGILRMESRSKSIFRELGILQTKLAALKNKVDQNMNGNENNIEKNMFEFNKQLQVLLSELRVIKTGFEAESIISNTKKSQNFNFECKKNVDTMECQPSQVIEQIHSTSILKEQIFDELEVNKTKIATEIKEINSKFNQFKEEVNGSLNEIEQMINDSQ